ncbi:MAG: hypothetical protein ABI778_04450 [Ignavibacteriota bacterium]
MIENFVYLQNETYSCKTYMRMQRNNTIDFIDGVGQVPALLR